MKITKQLLEERGMHVSTFGKNKAGNYVVRKGYFYTNGYDEQKFADNFSKLFPEFEIVNKGNAWKAFRGGASVANQSHWWVEFHEDMTKHPYGEQVEETNK